MAARVDLNGIKSALKTALDTANTTTASPIDLSSGLTKRVQRVLSVHPEMIRPQASFFPLVTCYVPNKPVKSEAIKGSQLNNHRRATVEVQVVGAVWNANMTDVNKDPADEDISYLMENVELALRGVDQTLGGRVNWHRPTGVKYFTTVLNQQTHLRAGILTLECEVFY